MTKISFVGDIMCERPLQNASRHNRSKVFQRVFSDCKALFAESDFVVGNLETVFAGEEAGFTHNLYSFNTPDEFAAALAESNIDLVTTATNHALDRGRQGLFRTLKVLDQLAIKHIGTSASREDREPFHLETFGRTRVAFLNYTYGTNVHTEILTESESYVLNLLMPQKPARSHGGRGLRKRLIQIVKTVLGEERYLKLKKACHQAYANKHEDILDENNINLLQINQIKADMSVAKRESNLVIVCLHVGGQFNDQPGGTAQYFANLFAKLGADYIICNHPHVVQKTEMIQSSFVAYCLGNFSISPSSVYLSHEFKPEYSIALHLRILDSGEIKRSFSILKICEMKNHQLRVFPLDELVETLDDVKRLALLGDAGFIYQRVTGRTVEPFSIQREYAL